jgi:quinolinate synthase
VVASTAGMIKYANEHPEVKKYILGTEEGIIHRLKKDRPDAEFYSLGNAQICFNMKMTKLQDVYDSLLKEQYEVRLDPDIIAKAKVPIDRMVAL